ncbi:MAG: amidase [Euzebyaceae bacterium]|nr:amidase [Euzebyaceae bacterium]
MAWLQRPALPGPLEGLRVGVKDVLAVAGQPRECGAPAVVGSAVSGADAVAVARLTAAGARLVARTATHPLAYGIVTPQTRNPRAPDRIAGGSSGGSAAALAAGLIDAALGTDTGGSIRIPAACCGVVGLKPTFGLVPAEGSQPLASSLDTVGPMARDVGTVARLLAALTGVPTEPRLPTPMRLGVPVQLAAARLDDEVRRVWHGVLDALAAGSVALVRVDLPALAVSAPANGRILAAEALSVHGDALARRPESFPDDVRARLLAARAVPLSRVAEARAVQSRLRRELRSTFADVHALVIPTVPAGSRPSAWTLSTWRVPLSRWCPR